MRPGIKFHDGSQLTAHDVAFSLKILKDKGHPTAQQLLRDFVGAEATDNATVVLRFAPKRAAPPTAKFNKIIPQAAIGLTRQESFDEWLEKRVASATGLRCAESPLSLYEAIGKLSALCGF